MSVSFAKMSQCYHRYRGLIMNTAEIATKNEGSISGKVEMLDKSQHQTKLKFYTIWK